jgi:hypothetical protein
MPCPAAGTHGSYAKLTNLPSYVYENSVCSSSL